MERGTWQATVHGVTKSWPQLGDEHIAPPQNPVKLHVNIFLRMFSMYNSK